MWSLLAAPCSPHDRELVSVSGRRFLNHGPLDGSHPVRAGDVLMVFVEGYYYIGAVAEARCGEARCGEVRFMGRDRWLPTDGMHALSRPC